jgi:hypothetical protein
MQLVTTAKNMSKIERNELKEKFKNLSIKYFDLRIL